MANICILTSLENEAAAQTLAENLEKSLPGVPLVYAAMRDAVQLIKSQPVVAVAVYSTNAISPFCDVFEAFQRCTGAIPENQAVICSEPSPSSMASAFSFGIDMFISPQDVHEIRAFYSNAWKRSLDELSRDNCIMKLTSTIRSSQQSQIGPLISRMLKLAENDFLVAFAVGRGFEALGNFKEAINSFRLATMIDNRFIPASKALAECLLVVDSVSEALETLLRLESYNFDDVEQKASLAICYLLKGKMSLAKRYFEEASALSSSHTKTLQAKVQFLLASGKTDEAFALLEKINEAGPFFAALLNDQGIKLSKASHGKAAIELYQRIHKIVRPELRYKISLNIALAAHRLGHYDEALSNLDIAEQEFGSPFEKSQKIRQAVSSAIRQSQKGHST